MSRLSECMAKAKMLPEDMAEVRQHANAAPDEKAGVQRYLNGLHDDLESLRSQLADQGHDLSVRRYTPPEPEPVKQEAEPQPAAPVAHKVQTFKTAKGSTYQVHEDGTTTRDKAFRPEHGAKEQGPQPKSETTFYVNDEQADALGEIQAESSHGRVVAPLGDGRWGVKYTSGPHAGKFEKRTVVTPETEPKIGATPVELWDGGKRVHFGNEITALGDGPEIVESAPKAKADEQADARPQAGAEGGEVSGQRAEGGETPPGKEPESGVEPKPSEPTPPPAESGGFDSGEQPAAKTAEKPEPAKPDTEGLRDEGDGWTSKPSIYGGDARTYFSPKGDEIDVGSAGWEIDNRSGRKHHEVDDEFAKKFGMRAAKMSLEMGGGRRFSPGEKGSISLFGEGKPERKPGVYDARGRKAPPKPVEKADQEPLRGPIGRTFDHIGTSLKTLVEEKAPALLDLAQDIKMATNPMSAGSDVARATAKDFANAKRQSTYEWNRVDKMLNDRFTPAQQQKMWEAADEESFLKQQGKRTKGKGLDRLTQEERDAVVGLQRTAENTFAVARKLGMIESEGLPSYVPRMVVDLASGKPLKAKDGQSSSTLDGIGSNLRTTSSQLMNRKHLTVEETEAAARQKFGEGAGVLRNIRTLALATAKLQDAIAGRVLVNKIKEIGRQTGADTVADSIPNGTTYKWFTLDHPAMTTWRPRFKKNPDGGKPEIQEDKFGNPIMEKVPIYVRGDFEGPLRAVLSGKDGMLYRALMNLKAKTMGVIMYSPLIHNGVEWGRALAAMPGKVATFKIYFEGNAAKNDPAQMREAINAGLVPIGARYGFQDISSLMEEPNLAPGRSWTAQILSAIPGYLNPDAGLAVKRGVDKLGDIWHNTLLWDRVADLQMGLYTNFRDSLVKKGTDATTAQRMAAHLANRYAGALPIEAMSAGSRKLANIALFSRSFTMGNLGAMKDAVTGMPADVRAQIIRDGNRLADASAQSYVRKKSQAIMAIDIGLNYLMTAAASSAIAVLLGRTTAGDEAHGYLKRLHDLMQRGKENALDLLNPMDDVASVMPQHDNEPSKQDRVYVGRAADGTAVYMRLPMGKIGEEFEGWITKPLEMLKRKQSTIARPLYETLANDKGFGRKVYDPYDKAPFASVRAIGDIVMNFMGEQVPMGAIDGVKRMITGEGDQTVNAAQALGPLAGITFSRGAPGGPEMGEYYDAKTEHDTKVQQALPEIRSLIKQGARDEAIRQMTELGIPPGTQANYMRSALNPRHAPSPQQLAGFRKYATPEQRGRLAAASERTASLKRGNQ